MAPASVSYRLPSVLVDFRGAKRPKNTPRRTTKIEPQSQRGTPTVKLRAIMGPVYLTLAKLEK